MAQSPFMHRLTLETDRREQMLDITGRVSAALGELGAAEGALLVHVPHTTAAVTINEGHDPAVVADVLATLRALIPADPRYEHAEGNSDAHLKAIMIGCDQLVPVQAGRLALGRWQRLFFCEFDGPRTREIWLCRL